MFQSYHYNLTADQNSAYILQNDTEDENESDKPGTSTVTYFSELIMSGAVEQTKYNKEDIARGYEEFEQEGDFDGQHNHVGDTNVPDDNDDQYVQETNENHEETKFMNVTFNSFSKSGSERSFEVFIVRCLMLTSVMLVMLK